MTAPGTSELIAVKVVRKTVEAEGVAGFELVAADGVALPAFTAGAHIDVHLGDGLIRQYSLCNDPREDHRYLLGVLREVESTGGSVAMHDRVAEGDLLKISAPRNNFRLVEDAPYSLLLAGGIGVTPILAMAQRLHALGAAFELHYCTRSRARMAFHDLFSGAPFAERVHFHFDDGPPDQLLDLPAFLATRKAGAELYLCGPAGFMEAVKRAAEASWPAASVHCEYFSADPEVLGGDNTSFQVKIASTGAIHTIPAGQTIVHALEQQGIVIPVSCEEGICGTCLTGVLEGVPDHRDMFLSDEEHAANNEMTLCCSRAKSPLLVLDL